MPMNIFSGRILVLKILAQLLFGIKSFNFTQKLQFFLKRTLSKVFMKKFAQVFISLF